MAKQGSNWGCVLLIIFIIIMMAGCEITVGGFHIYINSLK